MQIHWDQLFSGYAQRIYLKELSAHIHPCCNLHLKIWWNCSRILSLWEYFLGGSCFNAEPKSDLLPPFSACSCCWESFRAEPGTAPSSPPPSQPGRGSVQLSTSRVRRQTPSFEYPKPTSRKFCLWIYKPRERNSFCYFATGHQSGKKSSGSYPGED